MNSSSRIGINWFSFAPMIFVVLWSTGFIGSRLSAPYAEPLSFLSIRFAIVAVLLVIASVVLKAKWPNRKICGWALLTGVFSQGIYLGGIFWAIYYGMPAGVAALITALQPLLVTVLAGRTLDEKSGWLQWSGLFIGLFGVALVVWPKLTFDAQGITPITLAACFIATVSITIGSIMQKRFLNDVDMRTGNALQFVGGGLVVFFVALATENFNIVWNGDVIFAMGWLIFVLSFGAITLLYLLIRRGEVSTVSSLFFLVPAVTAVVAYFMFDETLSFIQLVGMAVCGGAVFIVTHSKKVQAAK